MRCACLVHRPSRRWLKRIHLYQGFDLSDGPGATTYRVSLAPDQWTAPPHPDLEGASESLDYRFETQDDYDRVYREMSLAPEELVLQLRMTSALVVSCGRSRLMTSSPERPSEDERLSRRRSQRQTGKQVTDLAGSR
jgi:hypothetical protein